MNLAFSLKLETSIYKCTNKYRKEKKRKGNLSFFKTEIYRHVILELKKFRHCSTSTNYQNILSKSDIVKDLTNYNFRIKSEMHKASITYTQSNTTIKRIQIATFPKTFCQKLLRSRTFRLHGEFNVHYLPFNKILLQSYGSQFRFLHVLF